MVIKVCIGSSCHLKGSHEIVELLEKAIEEHELKEQITLMGSFCMGTCSYVGVSVQVDEEIHTGITKENFKEFFSENILNKVG